MLSPPRRLSRKTSAEQASPSYDVAASSSALDLTPSRRMRQKGPLEVTSPNSTAVGNSVGMGESVQRTSLLKRRRRESASVTSGSLG